MQKNNSKTIPPLIISKSHIQSVPNNSPKQPIYYNSKNCFSLFATDDKNETVDPVHQDTNIDL